MGMKLVKKKNVKFRKGRFFIEDKIVKIDKSVAWQLNEFETKLQQYIYLHSQPAYSPRPSMVGFERVHGDALRRANVTTITPTLDAEFEKAKTIMQEIDDIDAIKTANEMYERYADMIDWMAGKKILVNDDINDAGQVIDTPTLGNPLKVSAERVIEMILCMAKEMDITIILNANGDNLMWAGDAEND